MSSRSSIYKAIYPQVDPEDRFTALEEAQTLLKSRGVILEHLFEILSKSDDGCIDFHLGDITIQFVRGFGVWSERKDVIQMTVELQKGDVEEVAGYEYKLDELKRYKATRLSGKGYRREE